jgi:hypothetical protein
MHILTRSALALVSVLVVVTTTAGTARTQADSDREAIVKTAVDYIEGYYTGDAVRMERALHPELAKRIVRMDAAGKPRLEHMGAAQLVKIAGSRAGAPPLKQQMKDVTVLDVFGNTASVKIVANDWIDYLHVAKWEGRWLIVNVLWEMKPRNP